MSEPGAGASLAGKVVIVTRPARRNIGYHAAAALRARGATLAIMGRNAKAIDHTIELMLVRPVGRHRKYLEENQS